MKLLKVEKPLVSVDWLYQNFDAINLIVLDGTLPIVTDKTGSDKVEEYQIPKTRFFDIKKVFSKQGATFPNTVLSDVEFENEAKKLGINKDSCIVVYDEHGIYSSPRVWWLFKTFGFDNIAVLDGGLPAWKEAKNNLEIKQQNNYPLGNFESHIKENLLINSEAVLNSLNTTNKQVIDARSLARFKATEPEPRPEIRSGRIPNSKNLPFSEIIESGKLKSINDLKQLFQNVNPDSKNMIFSCGSGITACVLALGATISEYKDISVYDGSWTEWGSLHYLPIEK